MNDRRRVIRDIMGFTEIASIDRYFKEGLHVDLNLDEAIAVRALFALAWITGAHHALTAPEFASGLLAESDEVYNLVRETWMNVMSDALPEDTEDLVRSAMDRELSFPMVYLSPEEGFSFSPN